MSEYELSLLVKVADLEQVNAKLKEGLQYYADGNHFIKINEDAWDTVSGEPHNFYEDESNTAVIEDGSIAKSVLAGDYSVLNGEE